MSAPVRTGDLRLRAVIQQRSGVADGIGGTTNAWTWVATIWANLAELSANEKLSANAINSMVTHKMVIRYQGKFADPKVMAGRRVVLFKDGVTRLFNIRGSHDDDERRRFLILDVEEGMNDG